MRPGVRGATWRRLCGARTGVRNTSIPSAANTASNPAVNLVSRSRIRNRNLPRSSPTAISRFRACWATRAPTGCAVTSSTWTCVRLPDPHLTPQGRFPLIAHHEGLQPTQHEVVWSLFPQGDSEGPKSFISRAAPHQELDLHRLPSAFRTHQTPDVWPRQLRPAAKTGPPGVRPAAAPGSSL